MTRREVCKLLGELFVVGLPGPALDGATRDFITTFGPGGVILFQRNAGDLESVQALCEEVHALRPVRSPLVAIDHEGGRVVRLGAPFTRFPAAARIGRAGSPSLAARVGEAMGAELRAVGIDVDFAPVLDVLTRAENAVVGDRAFSSSPQTAARMGGAFIVGLRQAGVIACGKHFPGHGHADADSHVALPRVEKAYDELVRAELLPFRRAITARVPSLMTAHVLYPALDPVLPATLSPAVLTDLLRGRLGYRGVVITDDLEMGAIAACGDTVAQGAVRALAAGADVVLVCHSWEQAREARAACERAVLDATLPVKRVEEAWRRVAALKGYHFRRTALRPAPLAVVGCRKHQELVEEVEGRASRAGA